jgi:hypothetical protein
VAKAKLGKALTVMEAPEWTPRLNIELESDELDQLKKQALGSEVVLVIKGKLCEISQRTTEGEMCCSIVLEDYDVETADKSVWDDLADDGDD